MRTNRRSFLAAAAAALPLAARSGAAGETTAGDKASAKPVRLGVIGVGWYGMVDAKAALKAGGAEVTAICDVDSAHLEKSAAELERLQGKKPKTFKLYTELLAADDLDAVIIATPPQWHALQFIAALQRGGDVYLEKPISYDVREGRAMVDAAAKAGRIVQVGFQRRQSKAFQTVKNLVAEGAIGRVVQVDVQIHYRAGTLDPTPQDPPATLDWDLWCGPGPKIPYSPQVGHFNWRLEKTSGHGHLVDWGIHLIDATRVILGESVPKRLTAAGGLYQLAGKITTPDTLTVHFEFDRCPVVWRHRIWGAEEYAPEVNNGIFLYGDKGTIFVTDNRWVVILTGKNKQREEFKADTDAGTAHMAEFLEAVRSRRPPSCSIADAYQSTKAVQLAMIAYETASVVEWDEAGERIVDNPKAAELLRREYRKPWEHPFKAG